MKFATMTFGLMVCGGMCAVAQAPANRPAPVTVDSTAPVVRSADVPKQRTAFYRVDGKPIVKSGPDVAQAPANALIIQFEDFPLGGRAGFRRITIPRGRAYIPHGGTDMVGYLVQGKLGLKLGKVVTEVGVGDTWRRIALQENLYTAIEEVVILESEAAPDRRDVVTLYTQTCASCHGLTGEGTERGLPLRKEGDPAKIGTIIERGRGQMQPLRGVLNGEEIAQVSAYVAKFSTAAPAPATPVKR